MAYTTCTSTAGIVAATANAQIEIKIKNETNKRTNIKKDEYYSEIFQPANTGNVQFLVQLNNSVIHSDSTLSHTKYSLQLEFNKKEKKT